MAFLDSTVVNVALPVIQRELDASVVTVQWVVPATKGGETLAGLLADPGKRVEKDLYNFKTYVEAGRLDPSIDVLVIDYESVKSNLALLIRQIRDELVQIVPGANLGKMLVNVPGRRYDGMFLYRGSPKKGGRTRAPNCDLRLRTYPSAQRRTGRPEGPLRRRES